MTVPTPEGPVLFLTLENVRNSFPSWKVKFSASNQKATAWRRMPKGTIKLKGTLAEVARTLIHQTATNFGGVP